MPIQQVRNKEGKVVGYRWGDKGRLYTGKGARAKAARQGRAIKASQNAK